MKNLMNVVKSVVATQVLKVKESINEAKELHEIRSKLYHTVDFLKIVSGYFVYVSDDMVYAGTLCKPTQPNAMVDMRESKIYVNTAFTELPEYVQNAILAHEIGHIVLNHASTHYNKFTYPLQAKYGFGAGLQMELEADKYAADQGHDMKRVLEYQIREISGGRAMEKRLEQFA